eukprot:TRINITY_DN4242_c0_g1_i1.p1 TRINITY_DN4242_c0_g1~~TRINITY_DN4242_c0_g1_i1.p1  ORF type:complete len:597 (-),score=147.76 TRINITY_DN4242_c0_g1_i1:76-1866(-)
MAYHSLYPSLTPHVPPASAPSVPPPSPAVSLPLMQGWVSKLGDKGIRTWSKRYFILDHEGLSYHVDENNTAAPRGKITLADIVSVEHSTPSLLGGFLGASGGYWQIQSVTGRIYHLHCDNPEHVGRWVDTLRVRKNPPGAPHPSEPLASEQHPPPSLPDPVLAAPSQPVSPYAAFIEFERSRLPPPSAPLAPAPLSQVVLHPPPQPPRPLRLLTDQMMKEMMFEEGTPLKVYTEIMQQCCDVLGQQVSMPISCLHLVCAYLVLSSVEWDNRNAKPSTYAYAPAYDADPVAPYMTYAIALIRRDILEGQDLPVGDAPILLTQIDTWIKRKRRDHEFLVQREDRESFIKRNIILVQFVRHYHLSQAGQGYHFALLADATLVLIDRLLDALEHLPPVVYARALSTGVGANGQDTPQEDIHNTLGAYLMFQKLKQENDRMGFADKDPYLVNLYVSVLNAFSQCMTSAGGQPTPPTVVSSFLAGNQRQIQSIMMMIFMKWQRDMALLYGASSADPYALFLLNMRIVARTASKINRALFPRLVDSLLELMSGLHARMPVHALYSGNVRTATPFPVLPAASNPHEEIVALCSMVNSSLTRHSQ